MADINIKHVLKSIIETELDQNSWKDVKGKITDVFKQIKLDIDDKSLHECVSLLNKVFEKVKMPSINVDDIRNSIAKVQEDFEKAIASINNIDTSVFKGIETSLNHISQTVDRIADKMSEVKSAGKDTKILGGLNDGLKEAEKHFDKLIQKRQQLEKKMLMANNNSSDNIAEKIEQSLEKALSEDNVVNIDGNFVQRAKEAVEAFDDVGYELQQAQEEGNVNLDIVQRWIKAAKELNTIYRTIQSKALAKQREQLSKELGYNMRYFVGTTDKKGNDIPPSAKKELSDGENIVRDFIQKQDVDDGSADAVEAIRKEISRLDDQIAELTKKHPELINKQNLLEEEELLKRIEEVYNSILNKKGKNKGLVKPDELSSIESTLKYKGVGSKIKSSENDSTAELQKKAESRIQELDKAVDAAGNNLVERYKAAFKFVEEYESQRDNPLVNQDQVSGLQDRYAELKPIALEAKQVFEAIIEKARSVSSADEKSTQKSGAPSSGDTSSQDNTPIIQAINEISQKAGNLIAQEETLKEIRDKINNLGSSGATAPAENINGTNSDNIQIILKDMNEFLSSNKGKKISDYFNLIATDAYKMSNDVKSAIEATIGSIDSLNSINIGANNHGGLVGDKNALILRKPGIDINEQNENAIKLQERLDGINPSGVNLGKIQEVIKAEEYLVELQNRVSGAPISTIGEAIEGINPDILNMTETSIRSLIQAMRELYNVGVEVDTENLGNILYDGQSGQFGIVDMDAKGVRQRKSSGFESFEEEIGAFAQTVRNQLDDIVDPNMAQVWSQFANMVDGAVNTMRVSLGSEIPQATEQAESGFDELNQKLEETQKKIKETNHLISNAKNWIGYLDEVLDDDNFKTTGKRDATEQLKRRTETLVDYRRNPDRRKGFEYSEEKIRIAWKKAYDEAKRQGVAASTLARYDTDVGDVEQDIQTLQKEKESRIKLLQEQQVELQRLQQVASETKASIDNLSVSLEKQQQIEGADNSSGEVAEEKAKTAAIEEQNDALKENINLKTKSNGIQDIETQTSKPTVTGGDTKVAIDTEALKGVLNSITYNVKVIQDTEGQQTGLIDIEALKTALTSLTYNVKVIQDTDGAQVNSINTQELQKALETITYNVKVVTDSDAPENKVSIDNAALESTLQKVFANILNPQTQQNDNEQKGPWALEKTLNTTIKGALDDIEINSAKIGDVATENTLAGIREVLDTINGKLVKGTRYKGAPEPNSAMVPYEEKDDSSSDLLKERIKTANNALIQYRTKLEEIGLLTGNVKNGLDALSLEMEGLFESPDKEGLAIWKQQFEQLKKVVGTLEILSKKYKELEKLQVALENPDVGDKEKEVTRQKIKELEEKIAEEEEKVAMFQDELRQIRQRAKGDSEYKADVQRARKADTDADRQARAEEKKLDALIDKYKELGRWEAELEYAEDGSLTAINAQENIDRLRSEIRAEKEKYKIYETSFDAIRRKSKEEKKVYLEAKRRQQADAEARREEDRQLEELKKKYQELGKWKAKFNEAADGTEEKKDAESNIARLRTEIDAQKEKIKGHEEELHEVLKLSEAEEKRRIQSQKAKKADKEAEKESKKNLKQQIKDSKKQAGFDRASSVFNAGRNTMNSLWKIDDEKIDVTEIDSVKNLNDAMLKLGETQARINQITESGGIVSEEDAQLLKEQTENVARYTTQVQGLLSNYERLSGDNAKKIGQFDGGVDTKTQLEQSVQAFHNGTAKIKEYDAATGRLTYTVKTGAHEFTEYTAEVRGADNAIVSLQGATKRTETFMESFKRKIGEIFRYFSASSLIYKAFNEIRKGIQYIREIDNALTELKKVTDETEETYDKFLDTAAKTADKVGSTIQEIVSSTADWARIGYSLEEAATLAESTSVLLNVSEFQSIDDATSALTSTLQAFSYTAEQSMDVVDVLNEVGKLIARR